MDLDTIKKLMEAMNQSGITKVVVKEEKGGSIELEKNLDAVSLSMPRDQVAFREKQTATQHEENAAEKKKGRVDSESEENLILSPMVGTYYITPSPEDPPYVNVGDQVEADTVVCIIEAMKVMNEVKAGKSGKIAEIFVKNGHPIEFGTKLFRIE